MPTLALSIDASKAKSGAATYVDAAGRMRDANGKYVKSSKDVQGANKRTQETNKALATSNKSLGGSTSTLTGSIVRLATAFLSVQAAGRAIRVIADFEVQVATLGGVIGATTSQMMVLEETARDLGATTRFSASEAAEGLVFLARAGFEVDEAMAAIPATLDLATVGMISLGQAADIASNLVSQFGLDAAETTRVVDVLTVASNSSNTNIAQLAEAMKMAGPLAASLGITVEEAAAAIGALGNAGIQASLAGTNLRGILSQLIQPSEAGEKALSRLGVAVKDVGGNVLPLQKIFKDFATVNLNASDALAIFGRRNVSAALALTTQSKAFDELIVKNKGATGAASEFSAELNDTLTGSTLAFRSAIQELILSIGDSGLGSALRDIISVATSVVRFFIDIVRPIGSSEKAMKRLATIIRTLTVAAAGFVAVKIGFAVAAMIPPLLGLGAAATKASVGVRAFNASLRGNLIGALAAAAAVAISLIVIQLEKFSGELRGANREIKVLTDDTILWLDAMKRFKSVDAGRKVAEDLGDALKVASSFRNEAELIEAALVQLEKGAGGMDFISKDALLQLGSVDAALDRLSLGLDDISGKRFEGRVEITEIDVAAVRTALQTAVRGLRKQATITADSILPNPHEAGKIAGIGFWGGFTDPATDALGKAIDEVVADIGSSPFKSELEGLFADIAAETARLNQKATIELTPFVSRPEVPEQPFMLDPVSDPFGIIDSSERLSLSGEMLEQDRAANAERLQMIQDSFMSEKELLTQQADEKKAFIASLSDDRFESEAERHALIEQLTQEHRDRIDAIDARADRVALRRKLMITKQAINVARQLSQTMLAIAEASGSESLKNNKGFQIANAVINTAAGVTNALAQPNPPGVNFTLAALVAAAGAAQIATISSASKGSSSSPSVSGGGGGSAGNPVSQPPAAFSESTRIGAISVDVTGIDDDALITGRTARAIIDRVGEELGNGANGGRIDNLRQGVGV